MYPVLIDLGVHQLGSYGVFVALAILTGILFTTREARRTGLDPAVVTDAAWPIFYEHVGAPRPGLRRLQRLLDAVVWPRLFGGCHTARDTGRAIEAAGFVIEALRSFSFRPCPVAFPVAPHILGRARRP